MWPSSHKAAQLHSVVKGSHPDTFMHVMTANNDYVLTKTKLKAEHARRCMKQGSCAKQGLVWLPWGQLNTDDV